MKKILTTTMFALACAMQPCYASLESGVDAYNGGDYAKAIHDLLPLAEKGNAKAQRYVGAMYAEGQGVLPDEKAAAAWYISSATGGDSDAQATLAEFYASGRGVPADTVLAAYWRWRSASVLMGAAKHELDNGSKKSIGMLGKPGAPDSAKETGCAAPVYHADAEHFGQDSTVDLLFVIDENGKTIQTAVGTSSGWPLLDKLARDAFAQCSFAPVLQNGKAMPALIKATYAWKTK